MLFSGRGNYFYAGSGNDPYWSKVVLLLQNVGPAGTTTYKDLSSYNSTVTNHTGASPMGPIATATPGAYSTSTTSIYFPNLKNDNDDSYLDLGTNSNWAMGTGDFTFECWARRTDTVSYLCLMFDNRLTGGSANGIALFTDGSSWQGYTNGYTFQAGSWTSNTWYHFVYCRSGTTTKAFVNGAQIASFTDTRNYTDNKLRVGGGFNGNNGWIGYLDGIRITKGVARYTAAFTKPNAPYPQQ